MEKMEMQKQINGEILNICLHGPEFGLSPVGNVHSLPAKRWRCVRFVGSQNGNVVTVFGWHARLNSLVLQRLTCQKYLYFRVTFIISLHRLVFYGFVGLTHLSAVRPVWVNFSQQAPQELRHSGSIEQVLPR